MSQPETLDSFEHGCVRLEFLGEDVDRPFAVYPTQFGKAERYHSYTVARQRYEVLARPRPKPLQPVCEDCEIVFRTDVERLPTYDTVFRGQPRAIKPGWACPCCGTTRYKDLLRDLSPEKQRLHNRNTMKFFHLRQRQRLFKD